MSDECGLIDLLVSGMGYWLIGALIYSSYLLQNQ